MKKAVLSIIAILAISLSASSETKVTRNGDTFKVEQVNEKHDPGTPGKNDVKTRFTWETKDGEKYAVWMNTKSGRHFIFRVSKKTGKSYKYYLPKDMDQQFK